LIVVVGLSHRSAPIEVRERLAVSHAAAPDLLRELVNHPAIAEALLLSTCNRVEVVAAGPAVGGSDLAQVAHAALQFLEARALGVSRHVYRHLGVDAVRHLFRVAASLDSLVLGEPQVLGQLKCAFDVARSAHTLGPRLNRVIPRAIRAAKRVRTETSIGAGQVSVPSVAVDLARQIFGELRGQTALLIGSGEMAETVARLLAHDHARLLVAARDRDRARELATRVGGEASALRQLEALLLDADVVITSTSASRAVVTYEQVVATHRARRGRSLFFIDLAVPRDVDPRVGELDRVFVYNIDDFSRVVAQSFSSRQQEAQHAERIVAEEAEGCDRWLDATEQVTPAIVALRSHFEAVLREQLERSLRGRLKHLGAQERAALGKMCEAAVKKLLHTPTVRLRQVASDQSDGGFVTEQLLAALEELFELELPVSRPPSPAPDLAGAATAHDSEGRERPGEPDCPQSDHDPPGRGANGAGSP
jgi:glutamyl-tRNA reductase